MSQTFSAQGRRASHNTSCGFRPPPRFGSVSGGAASHPRVPALHGEAVFFRRLGLASSFLLLSAIPARVSHLDDEKASTRGIPRLQEDEKEEGKGSKAPAPDARSATGPQAKIAIPSALVRRDPPARP